MPDTLKRRIAYEYIARVPSRVVERDATASRSAAPAHESGCADVPGIAEVLGVHVGTVRRHAVDARRRAPALYMQVLAVRASWRQRKHQQAVDRQRVRTPKFYRRIRARARNLGRDWREMAPAYERRT